MKKLLLFFIITCLNFLNLWSFWYASAEELLACTKEAKPCPDWKTFVSRAWPNCEFSQCPSKIPTLPLVCTKAAKLCPDWKTFVSRAWPNCEFSQCPSESITCPVVSPPFCPYWYQNLWSTNLNGCSIPEFKCNTKPEPVFVCPIYDVIEPANGCEYKFEKDNNWCNVPKLVCNQDSGGCGSVYSPVCWKLENNCRNIGTWTVCTKVFYFPETFENRCELEKAGASFISEWACEKPKEEEITLPICTTDVKRCEDGSFVSRTIPNCEFAACPDPKKQITLSSTVTEKANTALSSYSSRLKWLETTNIKKLITINKLIVKLSLMRSPSNSENMSLLMEYLIDELKEIRKEYQ